MPKTKTEAQTRVEKVISFIENLTVPSGEGAGYPIKLRPFQKKFIQDVYGNLDKKDRRVVRRAILSIARKNGKTTLIAALVLVHLVGPESIKNGEIYSAANERDQAALVFKVCRQIIEADDELSQYCEILSSTKTIRATFNGSIYRAISKESGTKHGFNPTVVIYDELSQSKNRQLYDVLDTSMGARREPLFFVISTQSNDPQHILSQLIDDGLRGNDPAILCHLYSVPEDTKDVFDEKCWGQANPALDDFRSLEDMRTASRQAQRLPSFESSFRNLFLNQRINLESPLISRSEWTACESENSLGLGEKIYLGLDLSSTTDLCALVAISAETGDRVRAWFWKPRATLQDHEIRDRAPYTAWAQQGYIMTPPGRAIDYGFVAKHLGEIAGEYEIIGIAYDRWRIENLLRELRSMGIDCWVEGKDEIQTGFRLVPWGQGYRDMAPAIDALELSITERHFQHDGNPVLTFCFANAIAVTDPAGNRKLDKSKTRFRIDGAVATAMAIGLKSRQKIDQPAGQSVYEELAKIRAQNAAA